ncbi:glutamate receptor ionotropic, kainate glr-3-like [Saccostrea echinata]|uniref:glutamate receptor ionotropic, kainate glr-3-like n=1 Tax=Saccostrea echinata TaxID=191078 RepID=UPI002A80CFB1|nr:glutamate receptor ionotropic, kainate glr-3-like [Saccostrea echinata]
MWIQSILFIFVVYNTYLYALTTGDITLECDDKLTALEIEQRNLDVIFVPLYASKLIHVIAEHFVNITHYSSVTDGCMSNLNSLETVLSTSAGKDRNLIFTVSGNFLDVQTAATMSFAVFTKLKWHLSIIFFDSSYAFLLDEFAAKTNKETHMQKLYNIDDFSNEDDVMELLKNLYSELAESHINFTVLCNHENARRLLRKASAFDQTKENFRHTALRDHSSWIVVTAASSLNEDIDTSTSLLDNVLILNLWQEEAMSNVKNCSTNNKAQNYYIYTLMWKTKTQCSPKCNLYRQFEIIGCMKPNGSLQTNSVFFPNSNYGFNRRHMLVTTKWWPPFTERIQEDGKTVDYVGYCMDLLREMGKALNFTYTVTEPVDDEFGRMLDNKSWSGMIGQLERREVDLMVATTSIRPDREKVMDFTLPFYYDTSTLLMKKPDPNEKKLLILAKPLRWEVMLCTGVVLVVCGLFLCLTEHISPYYIIHGNRGKQDFQRSFWYMFGALLTQGGESVPKSPSGRTLISAFWLFSIVLVGTYSGNLIAFLTVPLDKPPFNSLDEMIAQSEYKWGTIGGTFFVTWFNTSTVETLQAVWAGIKRFNKTDPEVLSPDPNVHIAKMYREKYVYFGDKVYMDIRKSNRCELMTAEEEIPNNYYAVGLPNNSLYTKIFSDQIISLQEGGIMQTFKEKHWPKSIFCFAPSGLQSRPISLIDLQAAFYLIGIGILMGFIVLKLEFILSWLSKKCCHQTHEKCVHLRTIPTNQDVLDAITEENIVSDPIVELSDEKDETIIFSHFIQL